MVNSVLILGGGSAGFLAAITLKCRVPRLSVTVLRSPDIGIIGVGEATTGGLLQHLHGYLKLDMNEFFRLAEPTWKLGIRFLWGKRPYFDYAFSAQIATQYHLMRRGAGFYCDEGPFDFVGMNSGLMTRNTVWARRADGQPIINNEFAYHIENKKFVSYLETVARRLGIGIQEDTVVEVIQNEAGIAGLRRASGVTTTADLFVDCSGFASVLLERTLGEPFVSFRPSLFCDRAVVGEWTRAEEPIKPYTTAETMNCGWCWQIDHEHHINRGYVYSSAFINDADAETEFREKNPKVGRTRIVKYKSGRHERGWVKNVVAIGNASGFVEPLESTGLMVICDQANAVAETLADCNCRLRPSLLKQYNKRHASDWETIRGFLAIHYKFNTRLDTPFWQACRADADLTWAEDLVEYYQENGPSLAWRITILGPYDPFNLEGYLSLLLGQQVPYQKAYELNDEDKAMWQRFRQEVFQKTLASFNTTEALNLIRSGWQWPKGLFYQPTFPPPLP
jgi:tryptophan halogenase